MSNQRFFPRAQECGGNGYYCQIPSVHNKLHQARNTEMQFKVVYVDRPKAVARYLTFFRDFEVIGCDCEMGRDRLFQRQVNYDLQLLTVLCFLYAFGVSGHI